jgi:hypothetical protein
MNNIIDSSSLIDKYLALFDSVDRNVVVNRIKEVVKNNFEMNTIGARLINTLVHQYFIKGGLLEESIVKEISFQSKLTL